MPGEGSEQRREEEGEEEKKKKVKGTIRRRIHFCLLINDKIKIGKNTPNSKYVFSYALIINANSKVCRFIITTITATVKN